MGMIFFVGPRAAGKTTAGKRLAAHLGLPFTDTDASLCALQGRQIADIVAQEGWAAFRAYENAALQHDIRVNAATGAVIATGGGMVLLEDNRRLMRRHGVVFYLSAPVAVLAARLQNEPLTQQRPSLTGQDISKEVGHILAQRHEFYLQTAHHVLDAARPSEEICTAALAFLAAHGQAAL